jgi:MoCo/4Fe-4S cofactor protein with predicted Tat translocation signal
MKSHPPSFSSSSSSSKTIWRSLDEIGDKNSFHDSLRAEFPEGASDFSNFNRRDFLKIMGASLALASLPACTRQPVGKIVPYVKPPEELIPGRPLFFCDCYDAGRICHRPAR